MRTLPGRFFVSLYLNSIWPWLTSMPAFEADRLDRLERSLAAFGFDIFRDELIDGGSGRGSLRVDRRGREEQPAKRREERGVAA